MDTPTLLITIVTAIFGGFALCMVVLIGWFAWEHKKDMDEWGKSVEEERRAHWESLTEGNHNGTNRNN